MAPLMPSIGQGRVLLSAAVCVASSFGLGVLAAVLARRAVQTRKQSSAEREELGQFDDLRGRNKHDLTPEQLLRRQKTDPLIALLQTLVEEKGRGLMEACALAERIIYDHILGPDRPTPMKARTSLVHSVDYDMQSLKQRIWQELPLCKALIDYNANTRVLARRHIPPTFRELRNICNLAQARASALAPLRLVTFDGDKTLYPDRTVLGRDSPLAPKLLELLRRGITVALVTAVGFDEAKPYEDRLVGLLDLIRERQLPPELCKNLIAVGGQSNYLCRCTGPAARLEMVPPEQWKLPEMLGWDKARIQQLLDVAEGALMESASQLGIMDRMKVVRKDRAVGLLYLGDDSHRTTTLMLDELAMCARKAILPLKEGGGPLAGIPFCTFNGGRDVFVDIGSKLWGIASLQELFGTSPQNTLHVGDQFSAVGNDFMARYACGTLWVDSPDETSILLDYLIRVVNEQSPK